MMIYLDVCCLRRLTDDQSQSKNRAEAHAVELIFGQMQTKAQQWISSAAVRDEVSRNPFPERRVEMETLLPMAMRFVPFDEAILHRAQRLVRYGYGPYDALHLASAESVLVDVLLSTDDRFVALALRNVGAPRVPVRNPIVWIQEQRSLWPQS